ncbi:MAG: hypothetical protein ACI80V_002969 [Rhodothermales bacterium]|jgi:hypothetical protein
MAVITVRNVPEDLHLALKELAETESRSLNSQIVVLLTKGLADQAASAKRKKHVQELWDRRPALPRVEITTEEILAMIREGREHP